MSLYAWSDLHIDYQGNLQLLQELDEKYQEHDIIIAGDLTDRLPRLAQGLSILASKFKRVFYAPGNHELWTRKEEIDAGLYKNSREKFHHIIQLADKLGVYTRPYSGDDYIIAPLFSWYSLEEDGSDSLTAIKQGEDASSSMWMDLHRCTWPNDKQHKCEYFLQHSNIKAALAHKTLKADIPMVSFSHFLPRQDLIFPDLQARDFIQHYPQDPHPKFNFTRVAGSDLIEVMLNRLGSDIHIYGHQHRNKDVQLDIASGGKRRYISHCLGYPSEPEITPTGARKAPLLVIE